MDQFTPTVVKNVARKIDILRSQYNYIYRELSKKSGVSLATLYDIINGNKIPAVDFLEIIYDLFVKE